VVTPQRGRDMELPSVSHEEIGEQEAEIEVKGIATMPGTPLNIPPTPLVPVDWDDLRQRCSTQVGPRIRPEGGMVRGG